MCKSAVIICDGEFPRKPYPLYLLGASDCVVCCDGALKHLIRKGIEPDAVIGDMDSAPASLQKLFADKIVHDPDQETNDLTKAFRYTVTRWPELEEITILGATGKAEDHTIANISLLMEYERTYNLSDKGIKLTMVSDHSTIFPICNSCELHLGEGRTVSIFSPDTALTIRSEGLRWKTDNVVFDNWWKASRNVTSEDVVKLYFSHKSMAIIITN